MIQKTTWSPDTCSCVITYAWDDALPSDQVVFTVDSVVPCPEHTGTPKQVFDDVLAENQTKNLVLGHVLENFPVVYDVVKGEKVLKEGIKYTFEYDAQRKLEVEFVGLDKSEVPAIDASVSSEFPDVTVK